MKICLSEHKLELKYELFDLRADNVALKWLVHVANEYEQKLLNGIRKALECSFKKCKNTIFHFRERTVEIKL